MKIKRCYLILLFLMPIIMQLSAVYRIEPESTAVVDTLKETVVVDTLTEKIYGIRDSRPVPDVKAPSFGIMMLKMVFSLLIIIVILYYMLKLIKRFNDQGGSYFSNPHSKVLSVMTLDLKHRIYTVLLHEELYVIAVSPEKTELIEKITDPERKEQIITLTSQQKDLPSFNQFMKVFKNKNKDGS